METDDFYSTPLSLIFGMMGFATFFVSGFSIPFLLLSLCFTIRALRIEMYYSRLAVYIAFFFCITGFILNIISLYWKYF